jgi:hypothetical protein
MRLVIRLRPGWCAALIGGTLVAATMLRTLAAARDANRIRRIVRRDLSACRGLCVDITLKDVNTVEHQPQRLAEWVRIVREVIDEVW